MKRTLKSLLMALIVAVMGLALAACGGPTMEEVVGEYEMSDVSVTVDYEGTTVTAGKEFFDYFRMTFKEDGTATVSAKYSTGDIYNQSGTYSCGGGKIKMTTTENGVSVTEKYKYSDGVITFKTSVATLEMKISMSIELTKVIEEEAQE